MKSIEGSRIVIPGGSAGIGLATAKMAKQRGADVVIASRSADRLTTASRELGGVETHQVNIGEEDSVRGFFEAVGECDHIFICAALPGVGPILEAPKEAFSINMDTRYWGHYYVCKYGGPTVIGNGSITFMSGLSAHMIFPGAAGAAASQGAIERLMPYMALELSPVRVNTLLPGVIETGALDEFFGDSRDDAVAAIAEALPVGRIAQPSEVAELALFVMGCEFMTGSLLRMDGGQLLL